MQEVFLDAGYLIALEFGRDQNHEAALKHWRARVGTRRTGRTPQPRLVTTTYIFDEVVTYLNGTLAGATREQCKQASGSSEAPRWSSCMLTKICSAGASTTSDATRTSGTR
jgi:hypothetical protein